MIPAELEKLVLAGKADFKTYATGGSGVATIPVSNNTEYIVITGFIWCPFHDKLLADLATQTQMIHTMRFNNGLKTTLYNFRDVITTQGIVNAPYFIPAYYLSKQTVQIDIFNFSKVKTWNYRVIPAITQEPDAPAGYATEKAITSLETEAGAFINNMGLSRNPAETPEASLPNNRNEFFDDIVSIPLGGTSGLNNPSNLPQWGFPLVTFNYVEVFKLGTNKNR